MIEIEGTVRFQRRAALFGAIALAASIVWGFFRPDQFFQAWLVGYIYWLGISLGSLSLLMVYYLTGGMWGYVPRRPLEAAANTLPLMVVYCIPVMIGMHYLYPWSRPGALLDPDIKHQYPYLNIPFFVIRAIFYFAIWILLAWWYRRKSALQDETADESIQMRLFQVSGPALVVYCVLTTFAGWDWIMSIAPKWHSTIFGMVVIVNQGLSAMAFAVAITFWLWKRPEIRRYANAEVFHDMGNMLLMFIMFWAYVVFSQFLIIWSGNLKSEIAWYLPRYKTNWIGIGLFIVLFYFFIPFLFLLFRWVKSGRGFIIGIAGALLFVRLIDVIWTIEPNFHPTGLSISWMDILVPVGMGAFWMVWFLWELKKLPLLALHDARIERIEERA
ncbi:MAG: hypothetical protein WBX15_17195 [Thermoanaerobaculia bacterium]